ncbi:hypothetical protein PTKIN_Ptkin15bG0109400 [Pterospermum kingtungense]
MVEKDTILLTVKNIDRSVATLLKTPITNGILGYTNPATLDVSIAYERDAKLGNHATIGFDKVQRLEGVLVKEKMKKKRKIMRMMLTLAFTIARKTRGREVNVKDNEESNKVKAVEEFQQMSVKQLCELATVRGISAVGTKKQLIQRLCQDEDKNSLDEVFKDGEAAAEEEEEKGSSKEQKIVTATKKGAAVLDQGIPDQMKAHYHGLQQGDDIYDAMLNLTNVGNNNKKFYVIQLLESDDGKTYMVYNRWGRVGVKGQTKLHCPFTS